MKMRKMSPVVVVPESQTGMEGISCLTCSVNSSGLQTNPDYVLIQKYRERTKLISY